MNYWHMQLHPDDAGNFEPTKIRSILKKKGVIGLGKGAKGDHQFINEMREGDIVLVRDGATPISLVRVEGPHYQVEIKDTDPSLDWFDHRRKIKILVLNPSPPSGKRIKAMGTLSISTGSNTDTFKYIDRIYKSYCKAQRMDDLINLLKAKHQIILQGPPGTGKTYTAKNIAEQMIFNEVSDDKKVQAERLRESDQFALVQFHPAYSYEDFVRGIVAKNDDGTISYVTEDKVLTKMANRALDNLEVSEKANTETVRKATRRQWLEQQMNLFIEEVITQMDGSENNTYPLTPKVGIVGIDEDAFRYDGTTNPWKNSIRMRFDTILRAYEAGVTERSQIKEVEDIPSLARWHATYTTELVNAFRNFLRDKTPPQTKNTTRVPPKKYLLLIDEINRANLPAVLGELIYALEYRGDAVDGLYEKDGSKSIVLPENLYLIGTMNTADRSVGHIDYAIRRRFAFVHLKPNPGVVESRGGATDLFGAVKGIFKDHLGSDFAMDDVQLGHSYFLKTDVPLVTRLEYEIKPILREYVRDGVLQESAREKIEALSVAS